MWDSLPRNAMGKVSYFLIFLFAIRALLVSLNSIFILNLLIAIALYICYQVNKKELKKVLASDQKI